MAGAIGDQFLMAGAGLRLLPFLRISGGTFLFQQQDPNPVKDDDKMRAGGFGCLSVDVAAFKAIKKGYEGLANQGSD